MIDTLIFSGGGPSGVAYVGILKALLDYDTFQKNNLKEIITTSVGIIFAILYLLDYNILQIEKLVIEKDLTKLLNDEDIHIDNLLIKYGLFSNIHIGESVSSFIKHKCNKNDLTLKEFHDLSKVILTVKVYNTDLGRTEYLNHINTPNIKLTTLAMMTTAIPYLFQPVKFNDYFYVDGGLKGNFPIEKCQSEKYLGINIKGRTCNKENFSIVKELPILGYTMNLMNEKSDNSNINDKKIFTYNINCGFEFNLETKDRKSIIQKGYNDTINYLRIMNS